MDYVFISKIIVTLILGSGSVGGMLWTVRKIYEAYLRRNSYRELSIKKWTNGDCDIIAKGLTENELTNLIERIDFKEIRHISSELLKDRITK